MAKTLANRRKNIPTVPLSVRVKVEERQAYEEAAKLAGMKPSTWMREQLNAAAKRESNKAKIVNRPSESRQ